MSLRASCPALYALAVCLSLVNQAPAYELSNHIRNPRVTPVVEVVRRARPSTLTLKVEKKPGMTRAAEATGTAVIVDERGYAVTNNHVVEYAARINAYFDDGSLVPAVVEEQFPDHDLAIIKLQSNRTFVALPLGPSSDLEPGEDVIAIGSPFGYKNTVSKGIVSALGREIALPTGGQLRGLIQIDAAINPGSSGGPLLNIMGELIGINVAIRDGAQGIAFAIPSDTVKNVLCAYSAKKRSRVQTGISCTELVEPVGVARQRVVVNELLKKGPAATAGLQPGDQILQVAGRPVGNRFDLERALWDLQPKESITLVVDRSGKTVELSLPLLPAESTLPRVHFRR